MRAHQRGGGGISIYIFTSMILAYMVSRSWSAFLTVYWLGSMVALDRGDTEEEEGVARKGVKSIICIFVCKYRTEVVELADGPLKSE